MTESNKNTVQNASESEDNSLENEAQTQESAKLESQESEQKAEDLADEMSMEDLARVYAGLDIKEDSDEKDSQSDSETKASDSDDSQSDSDSDEKASETDSKANSETDAQESEVDQNASETDDESEAESSETESEDSENQETYTLKELAKILREGEELPSGTDAQMEEAARAVIRAETAEAQVKILKDKIVQDPYDLLTEEQLNKIEETRSTDGAKAAHKLTNQFCEEAVKSALEENPELRKQAVALERRETIKSVAEKHGLTVEQITDFAPAKITKQIQTGEITFAEGAEQAAQFVKRALTMPKKIKTEKPPKIVNPAGKGSAPARISPSDPFMDMAREYAGLDQ